MKELLILLLDRLKKEGDFKWGLCGLAEDMWLDSDINDKEFYELENYIYRNKPKLKNTKKNIGYLQKLGANEDTELWGWLPHDKDSRIKWLNEQIKKA